MYTQLTLTLYTHHILHQLNLKNGTLGWQWQPEVWKWTLLHLMWKCSVYYETGFSSQQPNQDKDFTGFIGVSWIIFCHSKIQTKPDFLITVTSVTKRDDKREEVKTPAALKIFRLFWFTVHFRRRRSCARNPFTVSLIIITGISIKFGLIFSLYKDGK